MVNPRRSYHRKIQSYGTTIRIGETKAAVLLHFIVDENNPIASFIFL